MKNLVILLAISSVLITSCRQWDPIFSNYLDVEGEWTVSNFIITNNGVKETLDDIDTNLTFTQCLDGRDIEVENCLATQSFDGRTVEMDYNFSSSSISFGNDIADVNNGVPNYYIGLGAVWDILTLEEDLFVISTTEFFIQNGDGSSYDEVQVTLKR